MRGCLAVLVLLSVLVFLGLVVPVRLIGTGLDDFGDPGDRERRMAAKALFHGPELYGSGSLEIGDYNGPPLVLGWHVESVEECPPLPGRERSEADSYRAYGGGSASIRSYTLFGIPRGEMEVTCGGRRKWESYF